jgi:uncharacterized membrane protein
MGKHGCAAAAALGLALSLTCASASAADATIYRVDLVPGVPAVDKGTAKGVNDRAEVLISTASQHKARVHSALCKAAPPRCHGLGIKYGGGGHPSRYIFLRPTASRVSTVGQVYIQRQWYAAYKYSRGRSRFHNDVIITPGLAYGVGGGLVVGETSSGEAFSYGIGTGKLYQLPSLAGDSGSRAGSARAVNLSSTVIGHSTNAEGLRHATMWIGKEAQDMGVLADGGQRSSARAINDAGIAVGCADKRLGAVQVAVKFEAGAVVELGALNAQDGNKACATFISPEGVIAGWSTVAVGEGTHAFIMEGDTMVDLNDRIPEADQATYELMSVGGMNTRGQMGITAMRRSDSETVVLLLTPTK